MDNITLLHNELREYLNNSVYKLDLCLNCAHLDINEIKTFTTDDILINLLISLKNEYNNFEKNALNELKELFWLNNALVCFGLYDQLDIKNAKKELSKIYINIYDLIDDLYEKQTGYDDLCNDIICNHDRIFPKHDLNGLYSRCFLEHVPEL